MGVRATTPARPAPTGRGLIADLEALEPDEAPIA